MPVPSVCEWPSRDQGASAILKGVDHLVIVVRELEAAIASYRGLGFTVVRGGRHPIGTHNALIAFADGAYLELIAFFEPNVQHRWFRCLQQGGGLIDFCLQTDDLAGDTGAFRAAGVLLADPRPLSRVRPDGYELRWVLSIPDEHAGVAPFLIEDETPRAERVPRTTRHDNGVTGIQSVTVAVPDVAPVRRWYERVPGAKVGSVERADVNASGARVTMGSHILDFLSPRGPDSPLAGWLTTRGPSPYAADLTTSSTTGPLPLDKTLAARLTLV
ncbi:MAG: VOC family protein [Candidatus Rokuibacteriota bacterium]|nr:MAG: VOC family protein [Candidatus Rokubacteria bacterium]